MNGFREELGEQAYGEVFQDILALEEDPIPEGARELRGKRDVYRIYTYRLTYRIIYQLVFEAGASPRLEIRPETHGVSGIR